MNKLDRLQKLIENGGETKDLVLFDFLVEELSNYFGTSTDSIVSAIQELKDREEKEVVVNVEPPVVNIPAPVVNVQAPEINVDAPIVNIDTESLKTALTEILGTLRGIEPVDIQGALSNLIEKDRIKVTVDRVGGMGGVVTFPIVDAIAKAQILSGTGANGTRDLTSANTWYAVPSTVPSQPYTLVVTIENAVGTIRWGFDNTGTPSATNGNQAPSQLMLKLAANQVVYYASSSAGDDVNWTTKII